MPKSSSNLPQPSSSHTAIEYNLCQFIQPPTSATPAAKGEHYTSICSLSPSTRHTESTIPPLLIKAHVASLEEKINLLGSSQNEESLSTSIDPLIVLREKYNCGMQAYTQQDFVGAQTYFKECLPLIASHPNLLHTVSFLPQLYCSLAHIYAATDIELSLQYCQKTVEYIEQIAVQQNGTLPAKQIFTYLQVESLLITLYSNNIEGAASDNVAQIEEHCTNVIEHAKEVLASSQKVVFSEVEINTIKIWLSDAYMMFSILILLKNPHGDMTTVHARAMQYFNAAHINEKKGRFLHVSGILSLLYGKYHQALNHLLEAFDKGFEAAALGLAVCYTHLENSVEAISWFKFSLNHLPMPQDNITKILSLLTFNIGVHSLSSWSLQNGFVTQEKTIPSFSFDSEEKSQQFQTFGKQITQHYMTEKNSTRGAPLNFSSSQETTIVDIFKQEIAPKARRIISLLSHPFFENKISLERASPELGFIIYQTSVQSGSLPLTEEKVHLPLGELSSILASQLPPLLINCGIKKDWYI